MKRILAAAQVVTESVGVVGGNGVEKIESQPLK
jgi:hypothetical protein